MKTVRYKPCLKLEVQLTNITANALVSYVIINNGYPDVK